MMNQETARYTMFELPSSQLDRTLYHEIGSGLGYTAFLVLRTYDEVERSKETYHLVWIEQAQRAGIILIGKCASGISFWTDARSPSDGALLSFCAEGIK
jgi:hypothetical protein